MSKSKFMLGGVALMVLVVSLSGCGTAEPPPEPVTLSFVVQPYEVEYFTPLIEEFSQANPEITVDMTSVQGNTLQAYAEADVLGINLFTFSQLQSQGALLDLTPLIEQDNHFDFSDFYSGTIELFSRDDKVWGIPSGIDTFMLYYNKTLFDQNGLEYPGNNWTWDDLFEAAYQMRDETNDQFGYAVPEGYEDLNALVLISQHGGQIFNDPNHPTEVAFNHPLNVEAMQWLQDLYYDYNVAPTPDQADVAFGFGDQMIYRGVLQGDVGMWPGNFSDRGGYTWPANWENLNWGVAALPGDANATTSGIGTGYAISAQTENPETAWKWVAFLSGKIPLGLIPARRSLAESKEFQGGVGAEAADAALQAVQNVTLISPDLLGFQEALANFSQAIREIYEGTASAQEALDRAQALSK